MARGPRVSIDSTFDQRGVREAERSMDRLGKSGNRVFSGLKVGALAAAGAAGAGLAATIGIGVRELMEGEAAMAQVENRLKATGNAAGVTAIQIKAVADAIEKKSGVDADQILAGQAMLLGFQNIRGEAFKLAATLGTDLAVRQAEVSGSAIELKAAYTAVGKAINDPLRGLTSLQRVGISFNTQQKEQIKTLVETGRTMEAQKIITDRLTKAVGGSAEAFGGTTRGNIEKTKREFENLSAELAAQLLPAINRVLTFLNRKLIPYLRAEVVPFIRDDVVPVMAEWADGFQKVSQSLITTARAIKTVITWIDRFKSTMESVPGGGFKLLDLPGVPGTGFKLADILPRARGGFIPGPRGAGDVVPARLTPGEVVLNERQQALVGPGRIMAALSRTGGRIGDGRFAQGGIAAALSFARAQVGEPYVWGGGHEMRGPGERKGWDCSGFASQVAMRVPGYSGGMGTTMSLRPAGTRARGSEPVIFGFRGSGGARNEHMGIKIGGTWFDAGSGGVQVGDSRWDELRVPPGLEGLASGAGVDPGGLAGGGGASPAQLAKQKKGLLAQARALLGGGRPSQGGLSSSDVAGAAITARHRDDSLQDKRTRAGAEAAARALGITNPDNIAARAEAEVLRSRLKEINADARDVKRAAAKVRAALSKERTRRNKMYLQMRKTPARDQNRLRALRDGIANSRVIESSMVDELRGLIAQAADLQAEAAELGYDIGQLAQEIAQMPATAAAEGADATEAGVSADAQAQIDQATTATKVAQRAANLSAGFLRTVGSSGDLAGGGGVLTVNFMSLYPGDPAVQAEMARWLTGVLGGQGSVPTTQFAV